MNNAFNVGPVRETLVRFGCDGATGQEGSCKVTDARDDNGEMIAAIPEAVIRCLITKDLGGFSTNSGSPLLGDRTCQHETNDDGQAWDLKRC